MNKDLRLLFVGNSHTYTNFLPEMVKSFFKAKGITVHCDYQTHGGKGLDHHYKNDSVEYFILHGNYDYVILQGNASRIDPVLHVEYGKKIYDEFIEKTSSNAVIYAVWPNLARPETAEVLERANIALANAIGAPIAPAGVAWKEALKLFSPSLLYRSDGIHATPTGSYLAAACIFYAITKDKLPLDIKEGDEPHSSLAIDTTTAKELHAIAFKTTKAYNA